MSYTDLVKNGAGATDMRAYLVEGEQTAVTIRIPKNLRDGAKEAALLRGTTFSSFIRESMLDSLVKDAK